MTAPASPFGPVLAGKVLPAPPPGTMPGESRAWCEDCGTAPCAHPPRVVLAPAPRGVDLAAVVALLVIAAAAGLVIGWHATSWGLTP